MAKIYNLEETTYSTADINGFLEREGYPYAASIFREANGLKDHITQTDASRFFKNYFMDPNHAQYEFRKMQTVCIGHMAVTPDE